MKEITVCEPIKIGEDDFTLPMFLLWAINTAPAFNNSGVGIRSAVRIERAADEANGVIRLDDEDYDRLLAVVKKPDAGYPINPARVVLPFLDAIEGAE